VNRKLASLMLERLGCKNVDVAADCSRLERMVPDLDKEQGHAGFEELLQSIDRRYIRLVGGLTQWRKRLRVVGD